MPDRRSSEARLARHGNSARLPAPDRHRRHARGRSGAAEAYGHWGKGFHEAALNYGDCFSYVVAKANDCPLLYVGDDFAQTDIRSALG